MATQAVKARDDEKEPSPLGQRVSGTVQGTREFLHDVRVEIKHVTWPSRDEVVSTTGVVLATIFFFGVFLWLVDVGVQRGVSYIFKVFGA